MAISPARSAVLLATLIYLLSAGTAHARPSFELGGTAARAGDVVRFSITEPGGWGVAYHLEIGGEDVLDGRYSGAVSSTFTMPYLGESARTVFVDVELWWSDNRRRDKRRLEYLGPALPAPDPPAPAPVSTVQAIAPQATPPAPASAPSVAAEPAPAPARTGRPRRGAPRRGGKRHASETKRSATRSDERRRTGHRVRNRRKGDVRRKHRRSKRSRHWKGGFYTGYAEPGKGDPNGGRRGFFALNAIAPHSAALAADAARGSSGASTAVVVPVLLGVAAFTLAGTAVLRRRRLGSGSGRR